MNQLRRWMMKIPRTRWGKQAFLLKLKGNKVKILDVGCGNYSPMRTKLLCPDAYYVGIDVGDYNNTDASLASADEYKIFAPEEFTDGINALDGLFDAVISSHNLEHCNNPLETLNAMCRKLRRGGKFFISFPNSESVNFPKRKGTLNFYDDPTHIYMPDLEEVLKVLEKNEMKVIKAIKGYKPLYYRFIGGYKNLSVRRKGRY